MGRLSARDLHSVLDVARELGSAPDVDALHATMLPQMRRLVNYDSASFNQVAPGAQEAIVTVVDPVDSLWDGAEETFGALAHQNPLIAVAEATGGYGPVMKFSDLISARHLHRLDIYDVIYREIGVEHQIAFTLPAPSAHVIGCALNRRAPDFDERDRDVLSAVRPFVVQAYENVLMRAKTRATIAALELAAGSAASGVIVLDRRGRIEFASDAATAWIGALGGPSGSMRMPEPLESWSAAHRNRANGLRDRSVPLRVPYAGGVLSARFVSSGVEDYDTIVLREETPRPVNGSLAASLTAREREVLGLLTRGLSNGQMALELGVSERTVAKHLQHVYAKLGVPNRTAAVARASEMRSAPAQRSAG